MNTFYTTGIIVAKLAGANLAVERMQYILQRPLDLALARLSWKLDDLPAWLGIIRFLGYLGLWAAQGMASSFSREDAAATRGLTLLVKARKI